MSKIPKKIYKKETKARHKYASKTIHPEKNTYTTHANTSTLTHTQTHTLDTMQTY